MSFIMPLFEINKKSLKLDRSLPSQLEILKSKLYKNCLMTEFHDICITDRDLDFNKQDMNGDYYLYLYIPFN